MMNTMETDGGETDGGETRSRREREQGRRETLGEASGQFDALELYRELVRGLPPLASSDPK